MMGNLAVKQCDKQFAVVFEKGDDFIPLRCNEDGVIQYIGKSGVPLIYKTREKAVEVMEYIQKEIGKKKIA